MTVMIKEKLDSGSKSTQESIVKVGSSTPFTAKSKRKKKIAALAIVSILFIGIILIFTFGMGNQHMAISDFTIAQVKEGSLVSTTDASGTVVLPTQVSIVNMDEGYADALYSTVGSVVDSNTVLAELDVPDLEENRDDLIIELSTARLEYQELELANIYDNITLENQLNRLEQDIDDAIVNLQEQTQLLELQSSRKDDVEVAEDELNELYEQKEDLELSVQRQELQFDINIRKQQALIEQLETNLIRVEADIAAAQIQSPIVGTVVSINEDLAVSGSLIEQNTELFVVADTDAMYIDLEVYAEYSSMLAIGDVMSILVGNTIVEASITQIGQIASLSSDGLAATVSVRVKPNSNEGLTAGASAAATISLGTKNDVLLLPRGAYLTTGNQRYVYKIEDGMAKKTEVVFGDIQGAQVEVQSGLYLGDQIIISSYQHFIDQDVVVLSKQ